MPRGRPRVHAGLLEARRAANTQAAQRARARRIVQRSMARPAACWSLLRAARLDGETSDAQTLARILSE